jgi:hypothetical protein
LVTLDPLTDPHWPLQLAKSLLQSHDRIGKQVPGAISFEASGLKQRPENEPGQT